MTLADINRIAALIEASGRKNVPVSLSEWREMMVAKVKGKVTEKAGKKTFAPADTRSVSKKIGDRKKSERTVKGLKQNREGK